MHFSIYFCIRDMHDRGTTACLQMPFPLVLWPASKFLAQVTDHAFGNIQFPVGQGRQEFLAFIYGRTVVIIQYEQESLYDSAIIDIIYDSEWKVRMDPLTSLCIIINICMIFCQIKHDTDSDQCLW